MPFSDCLHYKYCTFSEWVKNSNSCKIIQGRYDTRVSTVLMFFFYFSFFYSFPVHFTQNETYDRLHRLTTFFILCFSDFSHSLLFKMFFSVISFCSLSLYIFIIFSFYFASTFPLNLITHFLYWHSLRNTKIFFVIIIFIYAEFVLIFHISKEYILCLIREFILRYRLFLSLYC